MGEKWREKIKRMWNRQRGRRNKLGDLDYSQPGTHMGLAAENRSKRYIFVLPSAHPLEGWGEIKVQRDVGSIRISPIVLQFWLKPLIMLRFQGDSWATAMRANKFFGNGGGGGNDNLCEYRRPSQDLPLLSSLLVGFSLLLSTVYDYYQLKGPHPKLSSILLVQVRLRWLITEFKMTLL